MREVILEETLEACPFCGGEAFLKERRSTGIEPDYLSYVAGCAGKITCWVLPEVKTWNKDDAINDWNTRNLPKRSV